MKRELNHRRANESRVHIKLKLTLASHLCSLGCWVLLEHKFSDVVAISAGGETVCFEVELSSRNLLRNLRRNFANGCSHHVIVAPDKAKAGGYRSILERSADRIELNKISIVTVNDIEPESLAELLSTVEKENIS